MVWARRDWVATSRAATAASASASRSGAGSCSAAATSGWASSASAWSRWVSRERSWAVMRASSAVGSIAARAAAASVNPDSPSAVSSRA